MIPIHKNRENPLLEFVKIPGVTFDDNRLPRKKLKESLLKEQYYLCAYCMSRINEDSMKIEHWFPQSPNTNGRDLSSEDKERERRYSIDYKNMLAICRGNEGNQPSQQHCDTRKGNKTLLYNPSNPNDYNKLKILYLRTGKIESKDKKFNEQLGDIGKGNEGVLNLNCEKLMSDRANVIRMIFESLDKLKNKASARKIDTIIKKWSLPDKDGKLPEYAGVAIYFLTKRRNIHL